MKLEPRNKKDFKAALIAWNNRTDLERGLIAIYYLNVFETGDNGDWWLTNKDLATRPLITTQAT